jgi:hypothetical protein
MNQNNMNETFTKLNDLIMKSHDSIICGPDCQKQKKVDQLKTDYLNAKKNLETAPEQLSLAAKNYYTYSEGEAGYNNFIEDELTKKSQEITVIFKGIFSELFLNIEKLNDTYNSNFIQSRHVVELYKDYLKENFLLEKKIKNNTSDIMTNDRKVYYEDQEIEYLNSWNIFYKVIYFINLFIFSIIVIFKLETTRVKKFFIIIFFIFFPFIFINILVYMIDLFRYFYKLLPKNAYT